MKVELLKYPTNEDWLLCKKITLNTVSKDSTKMPTDEWKVKLLESEHSPIRCLTFAIKMEIPYWVSVHFVRHKIGVEHFVSTQRTDRTGIDRNTKSQDALVSHIMYCDAQALINMAHKRLCNQASKETKEVMQEIVKQVLITNPEFKKVLVPNCVYRGGKCTEFYPCKSSKQAELEPLTDDIGRTVCPRCKKTLFWGKYCSNCGQAIKNFDFKRDTILEKKGSEDDANESREIQDKKENA